MPVPKRKRSRARRDSRFANKGIEVKAITGCSNCSSPLTTHAACITCGFYKGVKVLRTKLDRKLNRVEIRSKKETAKAQKEAAVSSAETRSE